MTTAELRAAIRDLGLTQTEFATLCGVEHSTVARWLSDKPNPQSGKPTPVPAYAWLYIERERARQQAEGMK